MRNIFTSAADSRTLVQGFEDMIEIVYVSCSLWKRIHGPSIIYKYPDYFNG
jgi:hypothetical protein